MGNFGFVKNTFGKQQTWYATNYSVAELQGLTGASKAKLPVNSLILCAKNDFIDIDGQADAEDAGYYSIVAIDSNHNVCPCSLFDDIDENGFAIEEEDGKRIMKLNIADNSGLMIDDDGCIKIKVGQGLMINSDGELCLSETGISAGTTDI